MSIWIINIILLLIFGSIINNKSILIKERKISLLLVIMFLQLLFLYVFNDYTILPDTQSYLEAFDYMTNVGWFNIADINNYMYIKEDMGWLYLTKTLSFLFNDHAMFLFVIGFVIIISHFTLIHKHSLLPWLSILFFIMTVFYESLFLLRQNFAIAICFFSIPYILERKLWKFLLVISIAFFMHKSALIFILLYVLYPMKINKKFFLLLISIGISFYVGFKFIINYAATHLDGYEIYKEDIFLGANTTPVIISLSVFIFIWIYYYPFNHIDNYDKLFFHMLALMVIINLSIIGSNGTMGRLNLYFSPAVIILLPNAVKRIKAPILKYISITIIAVSYFIVMINHMDYGFNLRF